MAFLLIAVTGERTLKVGDFYDGFAPNIAVQPRGRVSPEQSFMGVASVLPSF
jgi:hypothetical protein